MRDVATCRIRPMTSNDLSSVLEWRNHPDVARYMLTQDKISPDEHRRWFARASAESGRRLLIVEDECVPFGFVQFSGVAPGGVADWGFYVAPEAPQGSGRVLGICALDLAFTEFDLYKVCGQALASNESSIGFHTSLGFRTEGVLRNQVRVGADNQDLVCFGLLRSEWQPDGLRGRENI